MILRTPTTLSLDTAMLVILDYSGGSWNTIRLSLRLYRGQTARLQPSPRSKYILLKENASYRGVQREFLIFCIQ